MHRPLDKDGAPIPLNKQGEPDVAAYAAAEAKRLAADELSAAEQNMEAARARLDNAKSAAKAAGVK